MKNLHEIIQLNCDTFGMDTDLIKSIIIQESRSQVDRVKNGLKEIDTFAKRFEPGFLRRYLENKTLDELRGYKPVGVSEEREKFLRAHSWGCVQIMGQTAREMGFKEDSMFDLLDLENNIYFGVKYFRHLMEIRGFKVLDALDNWNGGGNPKYKIEVMDRLNRQEHLQYNWAVFI